MFVFPDLLHRGGVAAFVLIATGGVIYTLGALVYAFKRPNPVPGVFGFHEVFHACTLRGRDLPLRRDLVRRLRLTLLVARDPLPRSGVPRRLVSYALTGQFQLPSRRPTDQSRGRMRKATR